MGGEGMPSRVGWWEWGLWLSGALSSLCPSLSSGLDPVVLPQLRLQVQLVGWLFGSGGGWWVGIVLIPGHICRVPQDMGGQHGRGAGWVGSRGAGGT